MRFASTSSRIIKNESVSMTNYKEISQFSRQFNLYWKNDEYSDMEYELAGIYESLEEVKEVVNERKMGKTEHYKVVEVKDGKQIDVDYSIQNYSPDGIAQDIDTLPVVSESVTIK
jgi:hypothetical protein